MAIRMTEQEKQAIYIPNTQMPIHPCVDCGTLTDSFCDGELHPELRCKACVRVPGYGYGRNQGTPFCDWCERRRVICHFCHGQDWVREPIDNRETSFQLGIYPRVPMPPKPQSKEEWTQRLNDAFDKAMHTRHKQQMQHANPNPQSQSTSTASNDPPPINHQFYQPFNNIGPPQFDPQTGMTTMRQDILLQHNANTTQPSNLNSNRDMQAQSDTSSAASNDGEGPLPQIYMRADSHTPVSAIYHQRNVQAIRNLEDDALSQLWFHVQQWFESGSMPTAQYEDLMQIINNELASRLRERNITIYN